MAFARRRRTVPARRQMKWLGGTKSEAVRIEGMHTVADLQPLIEVIPGNDGQPVNIRIERCILGFSISRLLAGNIAALRWGMYLVNTTAGGIVLQDFSPLDTTANAWQMTQLMRSGDLDVPGTIIDGFTGNRDLGQATLCHTEDWTPKRKMNRAAQELMLSFSGLNVDVAVQVQYTWRILISF